ncbi:SixA phosphatase family protein [Winogradskyella haliclonae]|uniref:Phosphohistidine phosphatase SixA n=1 Tax=Winogradskyella haliclonae TaxID=2048558 RepID=A0ABQ2C0J4_9FLAO|nr:histidine phosphatase family protein [Winogradskyella haliclonae]GGI57288.1 phosphohistidine phosphatase SixA [Winogradskyella haliclonae]
MNIKKIIFVRHAKSSWKYNVSDINRPLKKRGIDDAGIISQEFKKLDLTIDFIYSSPANRALSTCKIFQKCLNHPDSMFNITEDLYDFSGERVLEFIKSINNELNSVMLFGHNYAFTSLVNILGDRIIDNLPTSGLVIIDFDITSWEYVKFGQTKKIMFPKDYRL